MKEEGRLRFSEAFTQVEEGLITRWPLEAGGYTLPKGALIRRDERFGGCDFHILRYLDLAVVENEDGSFKIVGLLSQKENYKEVGNKKP